MAIDLFKDIIPSILQTKNSVINQDNERDYIPFVVNRALSQHYDCILYANQMNMLSHADKLLQYQYFLNSIRHYNRPFKLPLTKTSTYNMTFNLGGKKWGHIKYMIYIRLHLTN